MGLTEEACYRAVRSRDARFDGRFFTGVRTTGVYCRPICPARLPRRENVRFFLSAAEAEASGFRPCKRCRPETAPGQPASTGTEGIVSRALRLVSEGALDEHGVEGLAERLGVGGRQLRRLFRKHVGTSPLRLASARRAHDARALLDGSGLSIAEVAFASGYRSIRQFNACFRRTFGAPPRALRAPSGEARSSGQPLAFELTFRPPLDFVALLDFFAARAIEGLEEVTPGRAYRRSFGEPETGGIVELTLSPRGHAVRVLVSGGAPTLVLPLLRRVRRVLDLDADPLAIASCLTMDPLLSPAVREHRGLRLPGVWSPFEALVRGIVGQQISVSAARCILKRLVAEHGEPLRTAHSGAITRLFPTPERLAALSPRSLGLPLVRGEALVGAARAVASQPSLLDDGQDLESTVRRLSALRGVGPWTAHYVAMRGLGSPDAFPASDLVLRRMTGVRSAAQLERLASSWRPFRAYAAIHLWHQARVK